MPRKLNHLLVIPKIANNPGEWYYFPLGIACISAALKQHGVNVINLNLNHVVEDVEKVLEQYIRQYDADIVSTGGLTGQFGAVREIFRCAKRIKPAVITIAGGGLITSAPVDAMRALEDADYGVIGEGDYIVCKLQDALESDKSVHDIPGIVFSPVGDDNYEITPGKPETVDIDKIPMPDYAGFDFDKLLDLPPHTLSAGGNRLGLVATSRSCPFRCTFCFHPSGQKFRQRNLDKVFEEIDYLVKEYKIDFLVVIDELFGYDMERVKEFCRRIKPYNIKFLVQFRAPDVTREILNILIDAGCMTCWIGVESADNRILKSMCKGITIEDTERALKLVYDSGVAIGASLILGDPEETRESVQRSIDWWRNHIHYGLGLGIIQTFPGTPLYRYAIETGRIKDPVQFIKDGCPVVKLSRHMTDDDYQWLFKQLMELHRETYSRPVDGKITEFNRRDCTIDISGKCVKCGADNHWHKLKLFALESLICEKCGRRHIAPPVDDLPELLNRGFRKLVGRYGKVAMWGINSFFYSLAGYLDFPEEIVITDQSGIRIGCNVAGKKVIQPVEVIGTESIRCVLVTVPLCFPMIEETVRQKFPGVEKIINICDLIAVFPEIG